MPRYTIGLDYGTNSVRALVVNVANGAEIGTAVWNYAHGREGVILSTDPNLARQHPGDYVKGAEVTLTKALAAAKKAVKGFRADQVIGIGVDTTGSTPLPVDENGRPLAFQKRFDKEPAAMAWLWKDHTSIEEAEEITALARTDRPHYLAKCGGTYSSEWFFSKILHCRRAHPKVFEAAYTWVECADWIPAMLTGNEAPGKYVASVCAAGHKAMYNDAWGGYPDKEFLGKLDPALGALRKRLKDKARAVDTKVGGLSKTWAEKTGLRRRIPVAVGAFDRAPGRRRCCIQTGHLLSRIVARAPATWRSRRWPSRPRIFRGCAVLCRAASFQGRLGSRRASRPWATSSTGS